MFVTLSVISLTLSFTSHIIVSNILRISFNPSHGCTPEQGSGVLSYPIALVPIIVVLFICGQLAMFYIYNAVVVVVVVEQGVESLIYALSKTNVAAFIHPVSSVPPPATVPDIGAPLQSNPSHVPDGESPCTK